MQENSKKETHCRREWKPRFLYFIFKGKRGIKEERNFWNSLGILCLNSYKNVTEGEPSAGTN